MTKKYHKISERFNKPVILKFHWRGSADLALPLSMRFQQIGSWLSN
jgi:hypothetical protein